MLREQLVLLKNIWQVDNHHFSIEWTNGKVSTYKLSTLQRNCPCAGCSESRKLGTLTVDEQVTAIRINGVGRYALRIQFRRGCSAGIFDFSLLRKFGEELACSKE